MQLNHTAVTAKNETNEREMEVNERIYHVQSNVSKSISLLCAVRRAMQLNERRKKE